MEVSHSSDNSSCFEKLDESISFDKLSLPQEESREEEKKAPSTPEEEWAIDPLVDSIVQEYAKKQPEVASKELIGRVNDFLDVLNTLGKCLSLLLFLKWFKFFLAFLGRVCPEG